MPNYTNGPFFYDEQTESIGCPAGWLARVDHTSKGDGKFGNPDDDGELIARLLTAHLDAMTPDHCGWWYFVQQLDEAIAENGCTSDLTRPNAVKVLEEIGLDSQAIIASLTYFNQLGGFCDCEIMLNVVDWDSLEE